jgi:hypothetical protein
MTIVPTRSELMSELRAVSHGVYYQNSYVRLEEVERYR